VVGVLLLTFTLFTLVGGDISLEIAGKNASKETINEIRQEYGLNKPLFLAWDSQLINHFKNALTFNFGRARDREPVIDKIKRGAGPSLSLMVPMFIGEVVISISLALVVAFVRGSKWDVMAVVLCVAGMSIPYLSFILFGQYFLAYKWGFFPVFFSPDLSPPQYVALPVLIGIVTGLGGNLRFYRTVMLDEMRNDYVRTAFAKGLGTGKVLFKHVLKNAMIPIITQVVLAIPFLFLGSLLLERFFGIPGLGYLMIEAIGSRDYLIINAMTYISAILFVLFNVITDICYAFVDPRISLE
jgi:peptide/nickel transport system permease protein